MTYFAFLAVFVGVPIVALLGIAYRDYKAGIRAPSAIANWSAFTVIVGHIVIAVIWTTPWDNYLVATNVWWYDTELVTGIVFGYVPIEEYTFFVVQPIMTGLLLLLLMRRMPLAPQVDVHPNRARVIGLNVIGVIWLGSIVLLLFGVDAGTYLGLELVWALPPVMLQLAFGADILWRHRRMIVVTIVMTTVYLALADALAIESGTWTIDPEQSFEIYLGGVLPIEELIFFLLTNTLVVLGITLAQSAESKARFFGSRLGQVLVGSKS